MDRKFRACFNKAHQPTDRYVLDNAVSEHVIPGYNHADLQSYLQDNEDTISWILRRKVELRT